MNALDRLKSALQLATQGPLNFRTDLRDLNQSIVRLRSMAHRGLRPDEQRITKAVKHFISNPVVNNFPLALNVSYGLEQNLETNGDAKCLIELSDPLNIFLSEIDAKILDNSIAFRMVYRGLISSYFLYPWVQKQEEQKSVEGWRSLRDYLSKRLINLDNRSVHTPIWQKEITASPHIFDDKCGEPYAQELLESGQSELLQRHRLVFSIPSDSWFIQSIVLAQIDYITGKSDDEFKKHLYRALELCERQTGTLRLKCLKSLLNRYSKCSSCVLDEALRDYSVKTLGTPWIVRYEANWVGVDEKAKKMVRTWLNLKHIERFFEVLSGDASADKRRLKFWSGYHEAIQEMYFILGSSTLNHPTADVRDFVSEVKDNLKFLDGAQSSNNNAFAMCIGDWVYIEFSKTNNACYVYKRSDGSINFKSKSRFSVTDDLKQGSRKWNHVDRTRDTWERQFEREIYTQTLHKRSEPSKSINFVGRSSIRDESRSSLSEINANRATLPNEKKAQIINYLRTRNIQYVDDSVTGGTFRIFTDSQNSALSERLKELGFNYQE